jgi:N-acetylmuramoyl-L-alanine amidase
MDQRWAHLHRLLSRAIPGLNESEHWQCLGELAHRLGRWRREAGLLGYGFGTRCVDGRLTPELALKIYVTTKHANRTLSCALPPSLRLWDFELPIDVDAVGRLRPQVGPCCGQSVRHVRASVAAAGTIGWLARGKQDGKTYLMSARHVVAPLAVNPRPGEQVVLGSGQPIGILSQHIRGPNLGKVGATTTVDLALVECDPAELSAEIEGIGGPPTGESNNIIAGQGTAYARGAASDQLRSGNVIDADARITIEEDDGRGGAFAIDYVGLVVCDPYSEPGDSGSAVLNREGRLMGLHSFGSDQKSLFHRYVDIRAMASSQFGIELETIVQDRNVDLNRLLPSAPAITVSLTGTPAVGNASTAVDTLARTLWAEARNQGTIGMEAVIEVILNRLDRKARFKCNSVEEVCKAPCQFSCWNDGSNPGCPKPDPQLPKLKSVQRNDKQFDLCCTLAKAAILGGRRTNHTFGADHYLNEATVLKDRGKTPSWAEPSRKTASIGDHTFYKLA